MTTYTQAVHMAAELCDCDTPDDYARGVCAILAELYALPGIEHTERMRDIALDIHAQQENAGMGRTLSTCHTSSKP